MPARCEHVCRGAADRRGHASSVRQDDPPCIVSIDYELVVDTEETDQRLQLLNKNVRKYGTISNTIALATRLDGVIRRAS